MEYFFSTIDELENSSVALLCNNYKNNYSIFFIIIFVILASLVALPLTHVDIAVKSPGIIRPANERTEIKSFISGTIDSVFYKEGSLVKEGDIVLRLKDNIANTRMLNNLEEVGQCRQFIHDLQLLTQNRSIEAASIDQLSSSLYKEQSFRFIHRLAEQDAIRKKAMNEEKINGYLAKEKVISPKEFFDIQIQRKRTDASYKASEKEQLAEWQQDLVQYKSRLSQCEVQQKQLIIDAGYYDIKSPVTGLIQGIYTHYPGNFLQANESICFVSPEGELVAECYISTRDISLIRKNQQVYFQVDAVDYNYFGVVIGQVIAIDNDYTIVNENPVFKIRCSFDSHQLQEKRGRYIQLKKGLSVQARFIIGRRSLWQLLFDKMDNWLNPSAPSSG